MVLFLKQYIYMNKSRRISPPLAEFSAAWRPGVMLGTAAPETLEFFLTERYCLYTLYGKKLFRARIFHQPWKLQRAELGDFSSTLLEAHGLQHFDRNPLLHYSEAQHVAVWMVEAVET